MALLEVYSDVICPWCYIGKRNMEVGLQTLAETGLQMDVAWRPFQLNPDMPREGMPRAAYRLAKFGSADRIAESDRTIKGAAQAAGLPIALDRISHTPNTLDAHRLIRWSRAFGRQDAMVDRLFNAYFVETRDIGDRTTLAELAAEAGLDRTAAVALLDSDEGRKEVAAEDQAVRQAGLSGVPTFVLERHVLFSGAVPPDVFAEAVGKAHTVIVGQAA